MEYFYTEKQELYILYGINCEIMLWIQKSIQNKSTLIENALFRNVVTFDDYVSAFGARNNDVKRERCIEIIKKLWDSFPGLGPYPILDVLQKIEVERVFYRQYRDHATHQLYVYLLGLYLYDNCNTIKTAVSNEIRKNAKPKTVQNRFILRWFTASIMHDIGYVLENKYGDPKKNKTFIDSYNENIDLTEKIKESLDDTVEYCFGHSVINLSKAKEKFLNKEINWNPKRKSIDLDNIDNEDNISSLLSGLENHGIKHSGLKKHKGKSALYIYYTQAHDTDPDDQNRSGFWDHGISSAILCLHVWNLFAEKIKIVFEKYSNNEIKWKRLDSSFEKIKKAFDNLPAKVDMYKAAGAIALHNINKDIWTKKDEIFNSISLDNYCIHLTDSDVYKASPLAFLLGLSDSLQDWDRPRFYPQMEKDHSLKTLADEDISIQFKNDKILLNYKYDNIYNFEEIEKGNVLESFYSQRITEIKKYLQPSAIDNIIGLNKQVFHEIPIPFTPLEKEKLERIEYFLDAKPFDEDEYNINVCLNQNRRFNKNCTLQGSAMLILSELYRCFEASSKTLRILGLLENLYRTIEQIISSSFKEDDPIIHTASNVKEELRNNISILLNNNDLANNPIPSKHSTLEVFLKHRFSHHKHHYETVSNSIATMQKLEQSCEKAETDEESKQLIISLNPENDSLLENLSLNINSYIVLLEEVYKSRLDDTWGKIVTSFRTEFNIKDIGGCFFNTNESLPHVQKDKKHLNIWD